MVYTSTTPPLFNLFRHFHLSGSSLWGAGALGLSLGAAVASWFSVEKRALTMKGRLFARFVQPAPLSSLKAQHGRLPTTPASPHNLAANAELPPISVIAGLKEPGTYNSVPQLSCPREETLTRCRPAISSHILSGHEINAKLLTPRTTVTGEVATCSGVVWLIGLLALYWCQLWWQLQVEWTANAQYGYGWFVPLLAAGLFWRRWTERPEPDSHCALPRTATHCWMGVMALLLLALLPTRLIHEANLGWRSAQWVHALILLTLSLGLLWRAGGWRWVRHFGFPFCFLLVAVPWPSRVEDFAVQGLMRLVAAVTVEVVGILGIPAIPRGNLLEIASGVVSVNEACSGVRSLQTSLMVALFLGELYSLRWRWRVALVPARARNRVRQQCRSHLFSDLCRRSPRLAQNGTNGTIPPGWLL